jgi:hypothetical protein
MLAQNPHKESEAVNTSELAFPAPSSSCFRASHSDCSAVPFEPEERLLLHIIRGLRDTILTGLTRLSDGGQSGFLSSRRQEPNILSVRLVLSENSACVRCVRQPYLCVRSRGPGSGLPADEAGGIEGRQE